MQTTQALKMRGRYGKKAVPEKPGQKIKSAQGAGKDPEKPGP